VEGGRNDLLYYVNELVPKIVC